MTDSATPTGQSSGSGLDPNLASLLCYLCMPISALVILLIEKDKKEVKFHAWHGLVIGVAVVVLSIVLNILSWLIIQVSMLLYGLFSVVLLLVNLGYIVLWIALMVKAYQGQVLRLPILTDIAEKQANN